ncbi:hypothetical protein ACMFMG_009911 [Clarireedia jacksonii]
MMDVNAWSMPWPAEKTPILIQFLPKLPRELVHKVVDDLPIIKVLRILCYKIDYLNECVLTHLHYRKLFSSSQDISLVVAYFCLFRETRLFTRSPLAPPHSLLAQILGPHISTSLRDIIEILQTGVIAIRSCLDNSRLDLDLLTKYERFPPPLLVDPFANATQWLQHAWNYWQWVKDAKLNLNARKADQLKLATNLVERYPHMVKQAMDPREDVTVCNASHVASQLRARTGKILRDRRLTNGCPGSLKAPSYLIELVPQNQYLWLLLDTLEKHPFYMESSGLEDSFQRMALEPQSLYLTLDKVPLLVTAERKESDFQYPEEIAGQMRTVLEGLVYIYAEDDVTVPRIQWEPDVLDLGSNHSSKAGGKRWPRFLVEKNTQYPGMPSVREIATAQKLKPLDGREYEWLESFLKTVTWMEEKFGPTKKTC